MLHVTIIPVLQDNYSYIIQSGDSVGIVDPGDAQPVIKQLKELDLIPDFIFNTHHHGDHIAGNEKIQKAYGAKIIAPESEKNRIKNIDVTVKENDEINFGDEKFITLETAGHTKGHVCFYFPDSQILFSGDTLFSMGCGRLFEGSAEDMFLSLQKLKILPDTTQVYCGHEYTQSNGEFCLSIEPENRDLLNRMEEVVTLRAQNQPTIPTTIAQEKQTNIFLRAKDPSEFGRYRTLKDNP